MKWLNWLKVELTEVATAKQVKELKTELVMQKKRVEKLEQLTSVLLDRPKLYTYKKKRW